MGLDRFKKAADKPKASKSSAQLVNDSSLEELCDRVVETSRDFKNAKAAHENAQAEVIDHISPIHLEGLQNNSLTKTFKINDKVMCTMSDRFKALDAHDLSEINESLKEIEVPLEKLFEEKVTLKLKSSVEKNEAELNKLLDLIGQDILEKYFEIKVETIPVKDFYKNLVKNGAVGALKSIIERIRYKPTVKVS